MIISADGCVLGRIGAHVTEHGVHYRHIIEAWANLSFDRDQAHKALPYVFDFGYTVGHSRCVEVNESDIVDLVVRRNRMGATPIVRGRNPEPTQLLTLIVQPSKGRVITAYYGPAAPREPWDPTLTDEDRIVSTDFWSRHALIL